LKSYERENIIMKESHNAPLNHLATTDSILNEMLKVSGDCEEGDLSSVARGLIVLANGIPKNSSNAAKMIKHTAELITTLDECNTMDYEDYFEEYQQAKPPQRLRQLVYTMNDNRPLLIDADRARTNLKNIRELLKTFDLGMACTAALLHDIGKLESTLNHEEIGGKMVAEDDFRVLRHILPSHSLDEMRQLKLAIEYHLIPGCIFTGEHSYAMFDMLVEDEDVKMLADRESICKFVDLLTLIVTLDVAAFGYISNVKVETYLEIRERLRRASKNDSLRIEIEDKVKNSKERICGLSCSYDVNIDIHTHVTSTNRFDFYWRKICKAGADWMTPDDWNELLNNFFQIRRIRYGLPIFSWLGWDSNRYDVDDNDVNPYLLRFLLALTKIAVNLECNEIDFVNQHGFGTSSAEQTRDMASAVERYMASNEHLICDNKKKIVGISEDDIYALDSKSDKNVLTVVLPSG